MTQPQPARETRGTALTGLLLRAGLFLFFVRILGGLVGALLNEIAGYFPAAALGSFIAATLATVLVLRTFERARLEDVGLGWGPVESKQMLKGFVAGVIPACLVVGPLLLVGAATLEKSADPLAAFSFGKLVMVLVLLLFGAVGEELMFRGYAFQILLSPARPFVTILPFAAIFAAAHTGNLHTGLMPVANTFLWGTILGLAYCRTGSLWLPIGIHFGWNLALPLLGVPLSGFEMTVTGYKFVSSLPAVFTGGAYGPEGGVITTVVGAGLLVWLWRSRFVQQPSRLWMSSNTIEEETDGTDSAVTGPDGRHGSGTRKS